MKKYFSSLLIFATLLSDNVVAQNTFPSSGNVGIGTTSPTANLEISNNGNASLRVGITSNRANSHTQLINSLAVIGDDSTTTTSNAAVAWNYYNSGTSPSWSGTLIQHIGSAVTGNQYGVSAANQGRLLFQNCANGIIATNGGTNIFISPSGNVSTTFLTNGNVGIGTTNPSSLLAVNGTVTSKKVKVTQSGWGDYVFHSTYRLRPLPEVEKFIQQYHHLPEIPSAEEIEKDGLDLGDNQSAVVVKIEELTLYIINLSKEVEALKKELRELKAKQN
jgi:hypothetical protein